MYSYIQYFCVQGSNLGVIQDESLNNILGKICDNLYYNSSSYKTKKELINRISYDDCEDENKLRIYLEDEFTGILIGRNLSFKYIKNYIENYNYIPTKENWFNDNAY